MDSNSWASQVSRVIVGPTDDSARPAEPPEAAASNESAYEFGDLLGEGGEGRVFAVFDRALQRRVAMKVMHPEPAGGGTERMFRFIAEARRTGSLLHASIPAVHDLGYTESGEPYFTMRLVEGRTLYDVLRAIRKREPEAVEEWSLVRLVQVLQQVTHAIAYAHSRGYIHRDLKPSNIAVGDYQETLVLDWGVAKRTTDRAERVDAAVTLQGIPKTRRGAVKGTPHYMSPEQAWGYTDSLDERADVFALGAILYEMLSLRRIYRGRDVYEIVAAARVGKIESPDLRSPEREMPKGLVRTCMKALSRYRGARHASATEFAGELQDFLDGRMERDTRRRDAAQLVEQAQEALAKCREMKSAAAAAERRAAVLRDRGADGVETNTHVWKFEDRAEQAELEAASLFGQAMNAASSALQRWPQSEDARRITAQLYYERFVDAEREGNVAEATWLRRVIARYDDGELAQSLADNAGILVISEPDTAHVEIARFVERGRRLMEEEPREFGFTPADCGGLAVGRHMLRLRREGYLSAQIPVQVHRGRHIEIIVQMVRENEVPAGFVCVHGGTFLQGTAPNMHSCSVDGFVIDPRPVLLRDYARFLDALKLSDPMDLSSHIPWIDAHGPLLRFDGEAHVFAAGSPLAAEPVAFDHDLPVVGIGRNSAEAYAEWMSAQLGMKLRLPTAIEWEKAARGCDGRVYPWGDRFDPAFCSMAETPGQPARLRPVGLHAADTSPYGVLDMAGGVSEWCSDDVQAGRHLGLCMGGSWYSQREGCTATSRWVVHPTSKNSGIGFRLCAELPGAASGPLFGENIELTSSQGGWED